MTDTSADGPSRPRIGRPPRVSEEQIVQAARRQSPESLSMSRLAADLGVDRKLVNYYVGSKGRLLELVAMDIVKSETDLVEIDMAAGWEAAIRAVGRAIRASSVAAGKLIDYVRFPSATSALDALKPIDRTLQCMIGSGFSELDAFRTMRLISQTAWTSAREEVLDMSAARHPQEREYMDALSSLSDELPVLHRLQSAAPSVFGQGAEQFEFDLDVIIDGLRRRLEV